MSRSPYYSLSSQLIAVLLVVLSAKRNGAVASAFLTEQLFCAARPIPNVLTGTHVKQPNNVCGSRVSHIDTYWTILSAKPNDDDKDKYFGALHRAVQTGDTRKLGKHKTFWVERCRELAEYKEKYGNCDVPQPKNRGVKRTRLQDWVANQRKHYRFYQQGKEPCSMTGEKIAILDDMDFRWEIYGWSGEQASWKMRYEELVEYKEKYGNCDVPQRWDKNPKLATWVNNQRQEYRYLKEGKPSTMTEERIEMLEKLEFDWYVNGPHVEWELRYEELKQYKEIYGDCNVPQRWDKNPQLGLWVHKQRVQYRLLKEGRPSPMTGERVHLLEKLEFKWHVHVDWMVRYDELIQYKKTYGDCNVPQHWKGNPKLGRWVSTQRTEYRLLKEGKKSSMTAERIDLLEKIEFEWTVTSGRRIRQRN